VTKFDDNWAAVFSQFQVVERVRQQGYCDITAAQFKALNLEPRLMTKIDHSHRLPMVMKASGLTILTLSNSSWRLGPYQIFAELPQWKTPDSDVLERALPDWLESLTKEGITGEGAMLNAADVSGILRDFCQEDVTCTITGRSGSGKFSFAVDLSDGQQRTIDVDRAQIEIDGGFEGKSGLYLVEAKKHIALDFNVRQLYYPFRTWEQKVQKPIRPIFMTLANDVFELNEYRFAELGNFSSIELVASRRYMLSSSRIAKESLRILAEGTVPEQDDGDLEQAPFPQADNFERIIDLLEFVAETSRSTEEIAAEYEFVPRQSDYYFSALRFLGLGEFAVNPEGHRVRGATSTGHRISKLPYAEKRLELARIILAIPAVHAVYRNYLQHGKYMSLDEVEKLLGQTSHQERMSGATVRRRAQTVLAWAKWLGLIGE